MLLPPSTPGSSLILFSASVSPRLDNEGHNKVALFLENDESKPAVPSAGSSSLKPDIKGKGPARIGAGRPVPTEYKLSMTNRASKNLFVFGEKEEDDEATGEEGHRKRRREWLGLLVERRC